MEGEWCIRRASLIRIEPEVLFSLQNMVRFKKEENHKKVRER